MRLPWDGSDEGVFVFYQYLNGTGAIAARFTPYWVCADKSDLWSQPWVGQSWEGWVIEQIPAARQSRGQN